MGDASPHPPRLGRTEHIVAYRRRLAILAGLALGLVIIHVGLFGGEPLVPLQQRIADGAVAVLLLVMIRRLHAHFRHRGTAWGLSPAYEALLWVLAGASILAPVAAILRLEDVAEALSLSSLSILTKLAVVYVAIHLASRISLLLLAADAARLVVPASAVVVLSFGLLISFGAILLSLPSATADGVPARPVDALFTATSASCVTGLIVKDTPRDWSLFGQIVILALIQVGGLGTMTMASVLRLLTQRRSSVLERLVLRDTVAPGAVDVIHVVRRVLYFTLFCEGLGALLLWWRWVAAGRPVARAAYEGLFHAVSAFCNAGFSLFSTSLERWVTDPFVNLIVGGLIVTGGIGFPVVMDLAHCARVRLAHRRCRVSLHTAVALQTTALLLVLGFALFLVLEWDAAFRHLPPAGKCLAASFASITPRTAGFDTVPPAEFSLPSQWTTMAMMFIGASPGSTGGGIKTVTAAVLTLLVFGMARGRRRVHAGHRSVGETTRHRAFAIAALMACAAFLVTFGLALTERADLATLLFEALSALGTVGLSLGVTPVLSTAGRLILALAMYAGRVGPLTLALSLPPARPVAVEYPEEEMMVG